MKNISFEEAMERMEEIIKSLEGGELELDKSLEIFEEGIKMYRYCTKKLEEMEGRVKVIMQQEDALEKFDFELEGE
jgi:exodeoxyribonuclease VII small subunit